MITPLPYVNLLTKVFKNFKVPLKTKEYIQMVEIMIKEKKLEALKFKCTPSG